MARQVILDTETTGIDPSKGHRIIEIGCVEMIDRKLTGNHFHVYINPEREIEAEAMAVHGITNEYLLDKPKFAEIAQSFFEYIKGAELVIHNAPFDVGFMDSEFRLLAKYGVNFGQTADFCGILDTLTYARKKHPGQKNNLDALCRRYGIDNSHRDLHGALLDAEILADVYLLMTGGQTALILQDESEQQEGVEGDINVAPIDSSGLITILPSLEEQEAHKELIALIDKKSDGQTIWTKGE